jgi:large subunit ribosomal protein L17
MRHRVYGRQLNRTSKQRKGLFKNLVISLFEHGAIETTEAKAKSIKGLVDSLVHRAQDSSMATARLLSSFFGTRAIVAKLMNEIAPAAKGRVSGFTRIVKLGNRQGDNTPVVRIELVDRPQAVEKKVEPKKVETAVKTTVKKAETTALKTETKKATKKVQK